MASINSLLNTYAVHGYYPCCESVGQDNTSRGSARRKAFKSRLFLDWLRHGRCLDARHGRRCPVHFRLDSLIPDMVRTYVKRPRILYAIDKGVPYPRPELPPATERNAARHTLLSMDVGDSVFSSEEIIRNRIKFAMNYLRRKAPTRHLRFSLRRVEGGWRVWRMPDNPRDEE